MESQLHVDRATLDLLAERGVTVHVEETRPLPVDGVGDEFAQRDEEVVGEEALNSASLHVARCPWHVQRHKIFWPSAEQASSTPSRIATTRPEG